MLGRMIRAQGFPVTLVFPPQGHFTQPYLALPCIKAFLQAHGFDEVELVDANVEAYDRFLTADYLRYAKGRAAERLPLEGFAQQTALPFQELSAFRAAAESAASADALIAGIDDAKAVLRGERFFDADQYVPAVRTIYHALRLVSAAHHPAVHEEVPAEQIAGRGDGAAGQGFADAAAADRRAFVPDGLHRAHGEAQRAAEGLEPRDVSGAASAEAEARAHHDQPGAQGHREHVAGEGFRLPLR